MLSTPSRVRNNLEFADITLTDQILDQYIEDSQAEVEKAARRKFTSSDPDYKLAVAAVTDLATARAIMRPPGRTGGLAYKIDELSIDKSKQEELKQKNAEKFRRSAEKNIALLVSEQSDLPFSTDQVGM